MSTFQSALRTYLLADSDITDIIGASGVYAFPVAQNQEPPYIVISRILEEPFNNLDAVQAVVREEWQLDCIALLNDDSESLKTAVIGRINNASPTTLSGFDVSLLIVTSVSDLSELEDDGSQTKAIRKTITATVKRTPTT